MSMQLSVMMIFLSVIFLYNYVNMTNTHLIGLFQVLEILTFKAMPSAQPFLTVSVVFAWEWKIISKSKVEHLALFWYRGPGELGNGRFLFAHGIDCLRLCMLLSDTKRFYITHGSYISWGIYLEHFFYRCKYISILHCNDLYLFLNESFW